MNRAVLWISVLAALGISGAVVGMSLARRPYRAAVTSPDFEKSGPACDRGISAAKHTQVAQSSEAPIPNLASGSAQAPQGMTLIAGGEFWMGSDEPMFDDAHPWHRVYLDAYFMDKTLVTN